MKRVSLLVISLGLAQLVPDLAWAQSKSTWGLSVSSAPRFYMWSSITDGVKKHTMSGSDIAIGLAHGSVRGGDWGISFVHMPFKEGGRFTHTFIDFNTNLPRTEQFTLHGVSITGVALHWYKPLVTIKERVQLGFNLAFGPGRTKGTIDVEKDGFNAVSFNPLVVEHFHTFVNQPVTKDDLPAIFPLARAELGGGLLATPRFKIKVLGGLNFPSVRSFRIEGAYFFN